MKNARLIGRVSAAEITRGVTRRGNIIPGSQKKYARSRRQEKKVKEETSRSIAEARTKGPAASWLTVN